MLGLHAGEVRKTLRSGDVSSRSDREARRCTGHEPTRDFVSCGRRHSTRNPSISYDAFEPDANATGR